MTLFLGLLILISIWVGFYQLVKQQGRILLRLDELERVARISSQNAAHHPHDVIEGLQVGTDFPSFALPDLSGKTQTLSDFRGRRLLLVNWDFDCGFCQAIADDLALLEADFDAHTAQIVFLASGDESFNRQHAAEHGLKSTILLLSDTATPAPFKHQGTPVAYFVDEHAQVAEPFASGADQVLALARRIASSAKESSEPKRQRERRKNERSLAESRIERNGLKAGTPAPGFRLPDLQGGSVSLDDYRGRRVLLVFSDPNCGPCDQLAPYLSRLHRQHRDNDLSVILVGRGTPEENRKKAEQFGFEFPVILQDKWKLSKDYGIFATPVAFLISGNGIIAKDVAVGKDAILDLADEAVKLEEKTAQ
jgi:peroxiredoxin